MDNQEQEKPEVSCLAIDRLSAQLTNFISKNKTTFHKIAKLLSQIPVKEKPCLEALAKQGWFIGPEWTPAMYYPLGELIEKNEFKKVDRSCCKIVKDNIKETEERLCREFPNRASILNAAFKSHNTEQYALSVPVFLSQADGICGKLIGNENLFAYNYKKNLVSTLNDLDIDEITKIYLSPLFERLAIGEGIHYWKKNKTSLNRNAILHGRDVNYDNITNSCKAISLLSYVSWILKNVLKTNDS